MTKYLCLAALLFTACAHTKPVPPCVTTPPPVLSAEDQGWVMASKPLDDTHTLLLIDNEAFNKFGEWFTATQEWTTKTWGSCRKPDKK